MSTLTLASLASRSMVRVRFVAGVRIVDASGGARRPCGPFAHAITDAPHRWFDFVTLDGECVTLDFVTPRRVWSRALTRAMSAQDAVIDRAKDARAALRAAAR